MAIELQRLSRSLAVQADDDRRRRLVSRLWTLDGEAVACQDLSEAIRRRPGLTCAAWYADQFRRCFNQALTIDSPAQALRDFDCGFHGTLILAVRRRTRHQQFGLHLVPKLRLGTHSAKLCFANGHFRETEFPGRRSQTEFGNEMKMKLAKCGISDFRASRGSGRFFTVQAASPVDAAL